jgi:biotin carboxyl carrier protein
LELKFTIDETEYTIGAEAVGSSWNITGVDFAAQLSAIRVESGIVEFTVPTPGSDVSRIVRLPFLHTDGGVQVSCDGNVFTAVHHERDGVAKKPSAPAGALAAPMFGVVADVLVSEGDEVAAHAPLMVLEAMKVMATIEAPFAGKVAKIHFKQGDVVPQGEVVMDLIASPPSPNSGGAGIEIGPSTRSSKPSANESGAPPELGDGGPI